MTSSRTIECRIVVDTLIFVPAVAHSQEEGRVYALLLRKCCKVVVSTRIREQYCSVMNKFGYPADAVLHELNRLYAMNKLREFEDPSEDIAEDLAPRKDQHIVAPCLAGFAHYIISGDRGIVARRERILELTGARVLDPQEAEHEFAAKVDCPADLAGQR